MRTTAEKLVMAVALTVALAIVGAVHVLLILHNWATGG